jgi:Leucine-rich repeat (LRR) protein
MTKEQQKIDDLLKSGTIENINLAITLNKSNNINYDFSDYIETIEWVRDFRGWLLPEEFDTAELGGKIAMLGDITGLNIDMDIDVCLVSKVIPNFSLFPNLEALLLKGMDLDTFPQSILSCNKLKSLDYDDNSTSIIPEGLGKLNSLVSLTITCERVTSLPDDIGNLTNLETLSFKGCTITKVPSWIGNFDKVWALNLSNTKISTIDFDMSGMLKLRQLNLDNTPITEFPTVVCDLPSIEGLVLDGTYITTFPPDVIKMKSLQRLRFRYTPMKKLPHMLLEMTWLENISLPDFKLGGYVKIDNLIKAVPNAVIDMNGNIIW